MEVTDLEGHKSNNNVNGELSAMQFDLHKSVCAEKKKEQIEKFKSMNKDLIEKQKQMFN